MRFPKLLIRVVSGFQRMGLALRYYSKLRYSWHLAWIKAGAAR